MRKWLSVIAVMMATLTATLAFSSAALAQETRKAARKTGSSKSYSAEELFRKYKSAVVKIVIRQQRIPIATGSGFFVSADGKMVTNHHVIKNALKTGSFSAEFMLADGTVVRDFLVSGCRDDRGMDLCLLKLPVKPKSFFKTTTYKPSPGESVYVIGHPQGLDYSITDGIVSALRESPTKVKELQITAAISPGNSGGPVFNAKGTLVGVASKFYKDGQNLNFGIQAAEVANYMIKHTQYVTIAQHRKAYDSKVDQTIKRWTTQEVDPAYANVEFGRPVGETPGFKEVAFDFGDDRFKVPLPKMFDSCRKVETKKGASAFQCGAMGNSAMFSVTRIPAEANAPMHELDGKKPVKEKPLPIVDMLIQEGSWAEYEKNLSPGNRKYLYSVPSEAKCRRITGNIVPNAVFTDESTQCRFSIYNDLEPDAYSYSIWVQRGSFIYDFYVWMEDAGYASYFNHIPTLAVLGARTDAASSVSRTIASDAGAGTSAFTLELQPSYNLANTESLTDGTVAYMYTRSRGALNSASPAVFMVNILKTTFVPKDISNKAHQLFLGTLEGFGARVDSASVKSQTMKADDMPVVIQTGYGRRKDQDLAVFHATMIGERATYMIFAFCDPKESKATFKDFQKMTLSLKRNDPLRHQSAEKLIRGPAASGDK